VLLVLFALPYNRAPENSRGLSVIDRSRLFLLALLFAAYPLARIALGV
jgi:hypothetical protein